MLLRASGQHGGEDYDLGLILGAGPGQGADDGKIPHAAELIAYAEAYFTARGRLAESRAALEAAVGPGALVDAAGILAIFDAVVRIADATGIALEATKAAASVEIRADLGIDGYPAAGGAP